MAAARLPALFLFLLMFSVLPGSGGEKIITAEPGENVVLPCRAEENKPDIFEWTRTDFGEHDHVALYRDKWFDTDGQHPDYMNRVDLQDKQMKDGDVSLVLNNVKSNDTGTYECRVDYKKNRSKRSHLGSDPISIVYLDVSPGNKEGQKDNGGKETINEENGGNNTGLIVDLPFFAAIVALIVVVGLSAFAFIVVLRVRGELLYKKEDVHHRDRTRLQNQRQNLKLIKIKQNQNHEHLESSFPTGGNLQL